MPATKFWCESTMRVRTTQEFGYSAGMQRRSIRLDNVVLPLLGHGKGSRYRLGEGPRLCVLSAIGSSILLQAPMLQVHRSQAGRDENRPSAFASWGANMLGPIF
jgi:hypothetical protein